MKTSLALTMTLMVALPSMSWANITAENVAAAQGAQTTTVKQVENKSVVVSPRTGISYSFSNPEQRPVILQSEELAVANVNTVKRIAATNPAVSTQSQLNAQLALVPELAQQMAAANAEENTQP